MKKESILLSEWYGSVYFVNVQLYQTFNIDMYRE